MLLESDFESFLVMKKIDNLLFKENCTVSQVCIIIPSSCQLTVEGIIMENEKMF